MVGGYNMSPTIFFSLTLHEANLVIKKKQQIQEEEYLLNYIATYNAMGQIMGGKGFKVVNPFEQQKPKVTKQDKEDTLAFINQFRKE